MSFSFMNENAYLNQTVFPHTFLFKLFNGSPYGYYVAPFVDSLLPDLTADYAMYFPDDTSNGKFFYKAE